LCKARFAELAVGRNIDPNLNLFAHDLLDGLFKQAVEFSLVVGLAAIFRTDLIPKFRWARKAADMGGQDPVRTSFHRIPRGNSGAELLESGGPNQTA
jgi:hypothetical protein